MTMSRLPKTRPRNPLSNEGEYARPKVGAKLLLSSLTLLGWLYGPANVTGSTLNNPVNAAVRRVLMALPKFSYRKPSVSVVESETRQRSCAKYAWRNRKG